VSFSFLLFFSDNVSFENYLASRLLTANVFPCFCIISHQGSQQTVQLKLERYAGKQIL
jgi:hypothetical protein